MEAEKYQKELFEFESPKKSAAKLGSIFSRTDFAIILTPEKMVFTAIGIIMLMVVFFALGVEKGRSAAYDKLTPAKTIAGSTAAAPAKLVKPAAKPVIAAKSAVAVDVTPKINPPAEAVRAQAVFDKTKPYMVVAATFSRKELALKEIGRLKAADLDAFLYYGEPYYLACVGSFKSKDDARKILKKVKRIHGDAYVRSR